VRFPNSGNPPANPAALLGALAAEPAYCDLTYLSTAVVADTPALRVVSKTFIGSRPRGTASAPTTCATPKPAPPRVTPSATKTPAPPASVSADLADTGITHTGWLIILGLLLLTSGALTVRIARIHPAPTARHRA
jgi:LPXTG-motif cell wall-anchored protein